MIHRTPQRTYNRQSIELWFSRLNRDWEQLFSDKELRWGRDYYRTGEVRSTELLEGSAIIHFKRGKEPLYVIVDWEGENPTFRESHPDIAPGRGLIVAGMYELEEFIADELPPVFEEEDQVIVAEDRQVEIDLPVFSQTERTGRQIRLRLLAREDGLWLEAGWNTSGQGTDWSHFSLRELTRWEREQLIGYTARAHRCGFRPGNREGTYRMQSEVTIERFFKDELGQWKSYYTLDEDPQLVKWKQGVLMARPVIDVEAEGTSSRFRFGFSAGKSVLGEELRKRLFRMPGHTHFVPGVGIFKVDPLALGTVHEWKTLLPSEGEGHLPRYLLYTFARDPHVEVRLSEELASWREKLEEASGSLAQLELPDYLREYQREGIGWLHQLHELNCPSLLADEMGLGKTLQILNFLYAKEALGKQPVLVVCPASVVPVWQNEVHRFFPGTEIRVLSRTQPFDKDLPALWIASYTQLRRNKALLEDIQFDYAILDEAQSIKNPDAKVTHACLAIQSRHRIALTGTPMENRPLDLWTLFRFLMPGFLGSRRHFEDQVKGDADFLDRLRKQIHPFILRRTKDKVAKDLPPKMEMEWVCPLTPVQRRCYEELTSGATNEFKGSFSSVMKEKRMHLFSLLTRLRQACCDPSLLPDHPVSATSQSGKLQSLSKRLGQAFDGGSKVVVFSQFVQFLKRAKAEVKAEYPDVPQIELTGATIDRERPVQRFEELEGPAVFFISLRAGGTGLNLQVADYVFLMDPWWNPAVEAQAIDRVHRIGQKKRVIVYRMITKGTIEERIERLKQDKGQIFSELLSDLDAPKDLLSQFDSLDELIALDEDAIEGD
ncbi:MAG: DEAD/DEAH box helicase [Puniceicoccaceae bacterium]